MADQNRSVTWRSLLLGTLAALAVCFFTPLNDLILSDTSLCAGFFPLGAVLILFVLVVGINGPLHRWFPRHALRTGELAVIALMMLVACSLPNWGLMRFLVPSAVTPFRMSVGDQQFWKAFLGMDLPAWLFPVHDVKGGRTSSVVVWFYNRVPRGEHIPFRAWLVPLAAWGALAASMFMMLAAMGRLVIDQWIVNERLPFPLVQVQSDLIEPPAPGFSLNRMFRSPVLWIGLGGVLLIHLLSCLNVYFPKSFPQIPLKFDLTNILSEEPFVYLRPKLKMSRISFTVVGVTFFIRSRAAFSLWATFVLLNLLDVEQGMRKAEIPAGVWADQHLGACLAFVAGTLWVGRHHWVRILRGAVGLGRERTYRAAFWCAVIGAGGMFAWLKIVGVHVWMAAAIVLFVLVAHIVVARVVAETGLPIYRTPLTLTQLFPTTPFRWFGGRDVYFASLFTLLGSMGTRESVTTFTTTGLGICQRAGVEDRGRRRLGGVIALALVVGFAAAAGTMLYGHYSYATPTSQDVVPARNYLGAEMFPKREIAKNVDQFAQGRFPPTPWNSRLQIGTGFVVTALLEVASLRWANWPLLPVGYVASYGTTVDNAWFSIFLGWLAQKLIVRFGGAGLFQKAKPFFVGMIFGEALAAGGWLIVNAIIVLHGGESQSVKFLL